MNNDKNALLAVKKMMIARYPRFATQIASVNLEFRDDLPVHTAATDGKNIYFDPNFLASLSNEQKLFLIAHELMHIKFEHMFRLIDKDGKMRDLDTWNIATDAIINANLARDGFEIKDGTINMPEAINYTAEELYEKLIHQKNKQKDDNKKFKSNGKGNLDDEKNGDQDDKSQNQDDENNKKVKDDKNDNKNSNEKDSKDNDKDKDNKDENKEDNNEKNNKNKENNDSNEKDKQNQDNKDSQNNQNDSKNEAQKDNQSNKNQQNQNKDDESNESKDNQNKSSSSNSSSKNSTFQDDHSLWKKAFEDKNNEQSNSNKDKSSNDESTSSDKSPNNSKNLEDDSQNSTELDKKAEFDEKSEFEKNRQERREQARANIEKLKNQELNKNKDNIVLGDVGKAKTEIDWKLLIRREVEKSETIWSQRRSIAENNYAYRLEENDIEDEAETEVMIDVSGSVSLNMVKAFLRQLKPLLKQSKLKVGCFNEKFWGMVEIKSNKDIDKFTIPYAARGASAWTEDWDLAVRSFSKKREVNKIVFTDGCPAPGTMPKNDLKDVNVIWLVYENRDFSPCCGKVIQINSKEFSDYDQDEDECCF